MVEEKYKKITREIGFSYFIVVLQLIFAPITVALLTRVLGPAKYGSYVLIVAFIALSSMVLQIGVSQYIIAKLHTFKQSEWGVLFFSLLRNVIILLLVLGAVFYFSPLSGMFLQYIKLPGNYTVMILALITMVLFTLGRVHDYYYKTKQKLNIANFLEFVRTHGWVTVLLLFFVLFRSFNLAHVFMAWSLFCLVSLSVYSWMNRADIANFMGRGWFKFKLTLPAIKFGIPISIGSLFNWSITYAERYILAFYTTTAIVGIYSVAISIFGVLLSISIATNNVLMPYIMETWWKDKRKNATFLNINLKYGLMILIPGLVGILMLKKELIMLLAGPEYLAAASIMGIICLLPLFNVLISVFSIYLLLRDMTWKALYYTIFGALINIILGFLLIPRYGMYGAAFAVVVSNFFIMSMVLYKANCWKLINLKFIKIGRILLCAILMGVAISFINQVNIFTTIISILVGAGVYFGMIFLTKVVGKSEMNVIFSAVSNFKLRFKK